MFPFHLQHAQERLNVEAEERELHQIQEIIEVTQDQNRRRKC